MTVNARMTQKLRTAHRAMKKLFWYNREGQKIIRWIPNQTRLDDMVYRIIKINGDGHGIWLDDWTVKTAGMVIRWRDNLTKCSINTEDEEIG